MTDVLNYPPDVTQQIIDLYSSHLGSEAARFHGIIISLQVEVQQVRTSRDMLVNRVAELQARVNELEAQQPDAKTTRIGASPHGPQTPLRESTD